MNRLANRLIAGLVALALGAASSPAQHRPQHMPSTRPGAQPQHQPQVKPAHKPDGEPAVKLPEGAVGLGEGVADYTPTVKPAPKPGQVITRPLVMMVMRERLVVRAPLPWGRGKELTRDDLPTVRFLRLDNKTAETLTALVLLPNETQIRTYCLGPGASAYVAVGDRPVAISQMWVAAESATLGRYGVGRRVCATTYAYTFAD
jgi:hypothetical protein